MSLGCSVINILLPGLYELCLGIFSGSVPRLQVIINDQPALLRGCRVDGTPVHVPQNRKGEGHGVRIDKDIGNGNLVGRAVAMAASSTFEFPPSTRKGRNGGGFMLPTVSIVTAVAVCANSRVVVFYQGDNDGEGYMSLKKL